MDKLFFTEEHIMIQQMVKDFAESRVLPVSSELDKQQKFPKDLVLEMGDLGLMGMIVPEKYGGFGLGMIAFVTAIIELGRVDASVAITMAAHNSLGTIPLLMFGNEKQKNKYLPSLATGKTLGAFGLTEPDAGSDARSTKTKALKRKDHYLVNGSKIFITNVGEAGLLSFTARIIDNGKNLGIAAFIIPTDTPGLVIGKKEKKMGWRASDTRQIYFKDMKIPTSAMLGSNNNGLKTFLKTLSSGRISIGALSIGTAIGAYEKALKYSIERNAFNKPIHEFQSISFKLADMATKIEASKLLVYHAAWLKDQGQKINKEASMAKLYASEAAMEITKEAIQIHGGFGYVKDYHVERYFRDAKILEIGEGTSEIQRLIISREILKDVQV
tara:strand:+ start:1402 stop:2556 length:1155 start_codon:yes stop_codon:yes gene_type:complete